MNAQGSSSQGTSTPPPSTTLNPVSAVLAQLFGIPIGINQGGFQMLSPEDQQLYEYGQMVDNTHPSGFVLDELEPEAIRAMKYREQVGPIAKPITGDQLNMFDPESTGGSGGGDGGIGGAPFGFSSFDALSDLLSPSNLGAPYLPDLIKGIGEGGLSGLQLFDETIMPAAREGVETGFLTDTDAIADRSVRTAQGNVAEQFAGIGQGFSSDFLSKMGETEADIRSQLGFQAAESAAGRRADILPIASLIPGAQTGAASEAGAQALNLGEQLTLDATFGGRAASLLQMLAGIQPTSAIPRGNTQQQSSKGGGGGISMGSGTG